MNKSGSRRKSLSSDRARGMLDRRGARARSDEDQRGTMRMLEDFVRIHQLLQGGRATSTRTLERELEASRRTVLRRIQDMRDRFHADIVHDADAGGYRYAGNPVSLPTPMVTEGELLSLYVASPILAQYRGTPLGERFERSFRKITALLPERTRTRLNVLPERVEAKARVPSHEDADRFVKVLEAVIHDRQLDITYYSMHRNVTGSRVVDPYLLFLVSASWYLLANDHVRGRILKFKIDRIWNVKETGKSFRRSPRFSVNDYLKNAFGIYESPDEQDAEPADIKIRFDPFAARYVRETRWHHSQKTANRSDGGIEVTFKVRGMVEIEQFVLGWGEHAEVLAPRALRDRMRARLLQAIERYGGDG